MASLVWLINLVLNLFVLLMLARCVISWVRPSRYHPVVRWIDDVTEPFLHPIKKILPPWKTGGLDFSPAIAILLAVILARVVIALLR